MKQTQGNQRETVELAYTAGIIDGEGYIGINRTKPNNKDKSPRIEPRIQVSMCDKKVPLYLQKRYGGTLIQRASNNAIWKDRFTWTLTKKKIIKSFGNDILPFLKTKKVQMRLLLSFIKECSTKRRGRAIKLPYKELLKREDFHTKMKKLNFRGVPATTNQE